MELDQARHVAAEREAARASKIAYALALRLLRNSGREGAEAENLAVAAAEEVYEYVYKDAYEDDEWRIPPVA